MQTQYVGGFRQEVRESEVTSTGSKDTRYSYSVWTKEDDSLEYGFGSGVKKLYTTQEKEEIKKKLDEALARLRNK